MAAVLESAADALKVETSWLCPRCQGTGWERVAQGDLSGVRRCRDPWHLEEWLRQARVPATHAHCTLENFHLRYARQRRGLRRAQYYVQRFATAGVGLWISGPAASGKTHLAVGIARALLARGYRGIRFHSAAEWLRALAPRGPSADRRGRALLRAEAVEARLLILDDLGQTALARGEIDALNEIIDVRERAARPILVTTRGRKPDLTRGLGERATFAIASLCTRLSLWDVRGSGADKPTLFHGDMDGL